MLSNGSLLIDELRFSDEGYYGCTAGNSGGFNRTEVTLIVRSNYFDRIQIIKVRVVYFVKM